MDLATVTGNRMPRRFRGFTLIEILVVIMLVSVLAAVAVPVVADSVARAREAALKENLFVMRKSLDDFLADTGRYPETLQQLVDKRYLRYVPEDPVLEDARAEWALEYTSYADGTRGILDVHSTSTAEATDGSRFDQW